MIVETTSPIERAEVSAPLMSVRALRKEYVVGKDGRRLVLDRVDLSVEAGKFVCLVGPSGAGKTTLLRCLAGLTEPTSGEISLGGRPVVAPPAELAVVFQDYSRSLMPWMSVRSNVELPLRSRGVAKPERRKRADAMLEAVGLAPATHNQYPWQLSGGMQQRVAIARALVCETSIVLMDEPFASVDAQTRADLEDLVLRIRQEFGVTIVLVTHDIDEAVYLGDEVVVLSGSPSRVTQTIAVPFGAERDQITTKSLPQFASLRAQVLTLISRQREPVG
ncbi:MULTISPECIES: ABC transporter ATP-binding protein [unclassified Microbacterium]|uniref:ABC transporter ATP-binding protein n=1 Tax=unclassified Microbacterium TaxID=2609290 RepID=UPI003655F394